MKTFLSSGIARVAIFLLLINTFPMPEVSAALSGNYTINPSGGATATNYTNFASAINDMVNGSRSGTYNGVTCDGGTPNGSGVSASVTFTVSAATYAEQVIIPAVSGVSSGVTITFDGVAAASRIVQFNTTTGAVLEYNGCQWVTFKNLTFQNTYSGNSGASTVGVVAEFLGATSGTTCDNNTLSNCIITAPAFVNPGASPTTFTIGGAAVYFSTAAGFVAGSAGTFGTSDQYTESSTGLGFYKNNTVSGCTINSGGAGILGNGSTASAATGNVFTGNSITNFYGIGINLFNFTGVKIKGNTINTNTLLALGQSINIVACGANTTVSPNDFTDVSGNTITQLQRTGIFISSCTGTAAYPVMVYNNFIGGALFTSVAPVKGNQMIELYNNSAGGLNDYIDIWYNSMNNNFPTASVGGAFNDPAVVDDHLGTATHLDIRNNIFNISATSGTGALFFYGGSTTANISFFNNNIFNSLNASVPNILSICGATYTAGTAVGGGGFNGASFVASPGYSSNTDLHIPSASLKTGVATPATTGPPAFSVTTDIDGDVRPATPHIGADDAAAGTPNDLAVSAITAPVSLITPGLNTISIQLTNSGTAIQTAATLYYRLNGAAAVSQAWTGSLGVGATSSVISFTVQGSFNVGQNTLKIYTDNSPVGTDTGRATIYTWLNGTYTIDKTIAASATNFVSFTSAATALNCGLTNVVQGAVVINVQPNTYTEQFQLLAASGTSATNTVKFNGGSPASVTLTFNGSSGNQHTIKMNGCNYITFANMTITGTNTTYAWPVHFAASGTNNNHFSKCIISVPTTAFARNDEPIMFSSSVTSTGIAFSQGSVNVSFNTIDTCTISGGAEAIYFLGGGDNVNCVNNKFRGNTITNVYLNCIYLNGVYGTKVLNNTITPGNTTGGGIFVANSASSTGASPDYTDISGNLVTGYGSNVLLFGGYSFGGIMVTSCDGGAGGRFRLSNNIIGNATSGTIVPSLEIGNGTTDNNMDIVFNTLVQNQNATGLNSPLAFQGGGTGNVIENNIFAITAASATAYPFSDNYGPSYTTSTFDYNIFYNASGPNAAQINGAAGSPYSLTTVVGGGGYNTHSQAGIAPGTNPNFISGSNLHITFQCKRGTPVSGITTDFDGQTRDLVTPAIGADEIASSLPVFSVTAPALPTTICIGGSGTALTAACTVNCISAAYSWSPSTGLSATSGASLTANPNVAATYTYTVTATNSFGCTASATTPAITVSANPAISVSPGPAAICVAGTALTASGGSTYAWTPSTGLSATSGAIVTATPPVAGTYTVTGIASSGCSSTTTVATLTSLNGIYTIDGSVSGAANLYPTTRTFNSFTTAVAALTCGGVSGAVTFNVNAGTYAEQFSIPAIAGASGTNTITFDGGAGNAATRIIQFATSTTYAIVQLNGAQWIRIKNLTINPTSTTNSYGIQFLGVASGTTCDNNIIQNCIITFSSSATTSDNGVVFSSVANGAVTAGFFKSNLVDGCTVTNGGVNIYALGSSSTAATANVFSNNTLTIQTNNTGANIFLNTINGVKIKNNIVYSTTNAFNPGNVCINLTNCGASATDFTEISGNKVPQYGFYGIELSNCPGASAGSLRTRIANNFVGGAINNVQSRACIEITNNTNFLDVWFNNCWLNFGNVSFLYIAPFYSDATSGNNLDIRDNIFAYTNSNGAGGIGTPLVVYSPASSTIDYNLLYNSISTANEANIGTNTNQYSNTTVIGGGGYNTHSVVANPNFDNNAGTYYEHVTSQCVRGIQISAITTDIDGDTRLNPPTIGADEIPVSSPTVSITAPASPTSICVGGTGATLTAACSANCTGITYAWLPSTGLNSATGASVVASPSIASTYTYTLTGTNSFGCTASAVAPAITVNPMPVVAITPSPAVVCLSGGVLTASGASTYSWTPSTGLSAVTGSTVTATPAVAPSYTVTGVSALGCSATAVVAVSVAPPLNGTYNINPAATGAQLYANGGNSFTTFGSAVSALVCAGVSGAVIFNVAAGTYAEQVTIPAIVGASLINTITFDGGTGNAATRILQSGNTPNYAIIGLRGAQWIRIKNLTIISTVTSGTANVHAVEFLGTSGGTSCDNNVVQNCIITLPVSTAANVIGFVFTGTANSTPAIGFFKNNLVDGCTVTGGINSVRAVGNSTTDAADNTLSNNTFINPNQMIVYLTNQGGIKVTGNTINSNSGVIINYAIDLISCGPSATNYLEVSGNKISQFVLYGIFASGCSGTPGLRTRIANNFIGGNVSTSTRGLIWLAGTANTDVWFNSCNFNAVTGTAGFGAFVSDAGSTGLDVRDNIFAYTAASGVGLPFVTTTPLSGFNAFDDNIFYNVANTNEASINGTTYTNANVLNNNYGGATTFNANSQVINPTFVSSADLHIGVQCIRGVQIPGITTDIDNQTRLSPPNIGADEIPVSQAPPLVVTPNNAVCTGGTTATLVASGAVSYTWSPTTNLTPTNGTSATETAQISALTIYTVTGTGTNDCTGSVQVPVATVAVGGTISPNFSIICSGGTKLLTVTGTAGHDYQWQISSDNITWANISGATNTTYTTITTDGNTNKYYRLLAQSNSCWNVASTTAEVDVSVPVIPITTSGLTDNSITLNWLPIGSGNYNISYSGASSGTVLGTTPPKTLTGLTANGNYTITLNQTGTGLAGCPATGTANVTTLCAAPPTITIISTGTTSITLSWGGGAGNYRVYYRPLYAYNGYFTRDVINGTSTTITTQGATQLYHSVTYEIYVSKLDCPLAGNIGQPSAKVYATTTPALACAAPTIDSVRSLCPVQIEVWVHGSPTNQYYIDVERLTPTVQPVTSYPVTGTYFTMNVSAGQNYLITARSVCGGSVSNMTLYPNALQIKPQCSNISNILLSNPTCNGFTASWNADQCLANNASYYQLFIRQVGTVNWNGYGVAIPAFPIGPYKVVSWLGKGKTFDVFAKAVYSCNGYLTYGATTQTQRITTLSAGCREEGEQLPDVKPITRQTSADNNEVFSLYPNPNNGQFTIDLSRLNTNEDAVRIEVTNMLGQTVITHLTSISDGHMAEFINMPQSAIPGTYIVRVTAGKNVYTGKMNISK